MIGLKRSMLAPTTTPPPRFRAHLASPIRGIYSGVSERAVKGPARQGDVVRNGAAGSRSSTLRDARVDAVFLLQMSAFPLRCGLKPVIPRIIRAQLYFGRRRYSHVPCLSRSNLVLIAFTVEVLLLARVA